MKQYLFFCVVLISILILSANKSYAQIPVQVKDVNQYPLADEIYSKITMNGIHYFTKVDNQGRELWRTDGTSSGTYMVKDINPGPGGSSPHSFCEMNGNLYFSANDGVHGYELWQTNGTSAGTYMVKDCYTGNTALDPDGPCHLTKVINSIFFLQYDDLHGWELWKTDGTASGTVLVKDIWEGPNGLGRDETNGLGWSYLNDWGMFFIDYNGILFFSANDGIHGMELWRSDGTKDGTNMVKDIFPGAESSLSRSEPGCCHVYNNILYFTANDGIHGNEIWRSDGTETGTNLVKDIIQGVDGSSPASFVELNGELYFSVRELPFSSYYWGIWKTDGSSTGTVHIKSSILGQLGCAKYRGYLRLNYNKLFFEAWESRSVLGPTQLWVSDGTTAGTNIIYTVTDGNEFNRGLNALTAEEASNNYKYFIVFDASHGEELWKTDGTTSGTTIVKDINPGANGSQPWPFFTKGNYFYFSAEDDIGNHLWKTDGFESGTQIIFDCNKTGRTASALLSQFGSYNYETSFNYTFPVFNNNIYFAANDSVTGWQWWKSDGTKKGTVLAKDPTYSPPNATFTVNYRMPGCIIYKNQLFLAYDDKNHGNELWKTDGTYNGWSMVKDIYPGSMNYGGTTYFNSSSPQGYIIYNDALYFWAYGTTSSSSYCNSNRGYSLWKTDGTTDGTVKVKEYPGRTCNKPGKNLAVVNDKLLILVGDPANYWNCQLWATDGTDAGSILLRTTAGGTYDGSYIDTGKVFNGIYYFSVIDINNNSGLWRTDGTVGGTYKVASLLAPATNLTEYNGEMYFITRTQTGSGIMGVWQLWKTDGTSGGTVSIKTILTDWNARFGFQLTKYHNALYFVAEDSYNTNMQIWKSDGTADGTVRITNIINDRPGYFLIKILFELNDELYFKTCYGQTLYGETGDANTKLWKTDGTVQGTVPVPHLWEKLPYLSYFLNPIIMNGNLYYVGYSEVYGYELYKNVNESEVEPLIITLSDKSTCLGTPVKLGEDMSITGGSGNYEIHWLGDETFYDNPRKINATFVSPFETTTFAVYVRDKITGEGATGSMTVTINSVPEPFIIGYTTKLYQMTNKTYSVTQDQNVTYLWSVQGGVINGEKTTTNVNITWTQSGIGKIVLKATNTATGCTIERWYGVIVKPLPSAICKSVTANTDPGQCSTANVSMNNGSFDAYGLPLTITQDPSGPYPVGTTNVALNVVNTDGAIGTCTGTITVIDNSPPTVTTKNASAFLDPNGTASITIGDVVVSTADNCGVASVNLSTTSFTCTDVGDKQVTVTVTDIHGNISTGTATVTILDNTPPIVDTKNISVELNASGNAVITATQLDNASTDNCGIASKTISKTNFDCSNLGANTVTLTVTDIYGNNSSGSAIVTVIDNIPPQITCPSNISLSNDPGSCGALLSYTAPVGIDNCSGTITTQTSGLSSESVFPVGSTTNTFLVTDAAGNTNICSFTVTVNDVENPVLNGVPSNMTVQCEAIPSPASPTATDNCTQNPTITFAETSSKTDNGSYTDYNYSITRSWTANDASGNSTTQTQTITVVDNTSPIIALQSFMSLWPPNHEYVTINMSDMINTLTDNCATMSITNAKILSASSDEPEDAPGGGDGNTLNDIVISSDCKSLQVRAEREGTGNGRVYHVNLKVMDPTGNETTALYKINIPHDQNGGAVDDGPSAGYSVNSNCSLYKIAEMGNRIPEGYHLAQNYPNPVNPTTTINYTIPEDVHVTLKVYDVYSRKVATLVDVTQKAGMYSVLFDSKDLPSGMYTYRLETEGKSLTKMMTLVK